MLRAGGIVIKYGPHTALAGVDLELRPHEVLGLLGPNGAGKTTLLRRLAGLLPGQAGTVDLDGGDPATDGRARARIGYLPEDPPLYPDDTALQYVTYLAALSGVPRGRRRSEAAATLERVGAGKLAGRLVGRLSKGQRQRVALAGAIVHGPDVLLLDEPAEGLDPRQLVGLRRLLADLRQNASIVFSTHLLAEAQTVCDRVVVIDRGRVVLDRPAGAAAGGTLLRLGVGGAEPGRVRSTLLSLPGVRGIQGQWSGLPSTPAPVQVICTVDAPSVAETIAAEVCGHGWRLRELALVRDDLETAFLAVVTGDRRAGWS